MDNSPESPESTPTGSQLNPQINFQSKNAGNILHWVIILLLLLILGVGTFIAWQLYKSNTSHISNDSYKSNASNQSNNKQPAVNQPTSILNQASQKKVAYVKDSSVWIIGSDGTGKVTVSLENSETSDSIYFPGIAWKKSNELSYIFCWQSGCKINTAMLNQPNRWQGETDFGVDEKGFPADKTQILALAWNHTGNQLAYIYRLPDGQMRMDFKSGSVKNVIKNFSVPPTGRGGTLDDAVSIYFSPDDKYVLVTNTDGLPNGPDKHSIWVFESSGKEILSIESDTSDFGKTNGWATQAKWLENGIFLYKIGDKLYTWPLKSKEPPTYYTAVRTSFYNPTPGPVGTASIYYWSTSTSLPNIWLISNGEQQSIIKFLDGYFKQETLDNSHLVALKAQKAPAGQEAMSPFVSAGLSEIDINSKQVTDLDSGDINLFAISP